MRVPERNWATRLASNHFGKGIVLDTLTYWAVVGIDGLPALKDIFGTILLSRSTADEIGHLNDDDDVIPGTERSGTTYFHKGHFHVDEFTPDREKRLADAIAKREDAMQTDCKVVPVHAPNDIDPRLLEESVAVRSPRSSLPGSARFRACPSSDHLAHVRSRISGASASSWV